MFVKDMYLNELIKSSACEAPRTQGGVCGTRSGQALRSFSNHHPLQKQEILVESIVKIVDAN